MGGEKRVGDQEWSELWWNLEVDIQLTCVNHIANQGHHGPWLLRMFFTKTKLKKCTKNLKYCNILENNVFFFFNK